MFSKEWENLGEKKNKAQKIAADAVANGQDAQAALKDFYKEIRWGNPEEILKSIWE